MLLTWIGSLLVWRSCSPKTTRCFPGLRHIKVFWLVILYLLWSVTVSPWDTCCHLRHTAVSGSDDPVLVDQGSSTEVESSAILRLKRCTFKQFILFEVIGYFAFLVKREWMLRGIFYLKRNLPGPWPWHSCLPIYNFVVSTDLGLNSRDSTPLGPVTQCKS